MARKASPVKLDPMPEINPEAHQAEAGALTMLGDIAQGIHEERDLVNQLLGQAQMADAFAKFSVTVTTSKLAFVKENKLYRALQGKKTGDGHQFSGTWEEFCSLLGRSREQIDEDIRNLRALGEEALESMSRMGIGYRELRQYRKLPDDQKTALIEVAKTGDKEAFVDLAEEMIAKHSKEKEELQAKLEDVQQDYDALSKVEADTSKKLRDVKLELQRAQLRTAPWSEKVAPFQEEIAKRQVLIDEALGRHLQAVEALDAWWIGEAVNQPGYDPEAYVEMPLEVRTVLIELDDAITRTAHLVAAARDQIINRFGDELALARQHQLQPEEQAQ
ncbi:hypothetical protein ACFZOW_31115 [Pseudomonas aeruginosa]|uniref:hypothetical protein n=3 Tax=Pseudomonas aeruginosa TaxID=287 RepID=UPI00053DAD2D|nr:hypothetical protein [Pseudomonas aeruginosa]AWZ85215.1 hypothetical protein CSC41_3570 [Pseudomonas aeruginosa]MCK0979865.1 hypothetical protein [Pseudomonas aeruginosa]MCK1101134.1 hypothetical protein [Pseudomonas aeruginosa]MCK1174832.1 hypothetical protein [Pseudomonas aeruginosa]MCL8241446.1 hypothetical protein [Pseudomonas aeruginosa]